MRPTCPKCTSGSTRRNRRNASLKHKVMYLLGRFPWECLTCEKRFFDPMRYAKSTRGSHGEIYFSPSDSDRARVREQFPVAGRIPSPAQSQAASNLDLSKGLIPTRRRS